MWRKFIRSIGPALVVAVLMGTTGGCEQPPENAKFSRYTGALIWDGESKEEYRDISPAAQEVGLSVGLLLPKDAYANYPACLTSGGNCNVNTTSNVLCLGDTFSFQNVASTSGGTCTTWALGGDLFATAGHCMHPASSDPDNYDFATRTANSNPTNAEAVREKADFAKKACSNYTVLMRFRVNDNNSADQSNTAFLPEQIFTCREVVAHGKIQPNPRVVTWASCDKNAAGCQCPAGNGCALKDCRAYPQGTVAPPFCIPDGNSVTRGSDGDDWVIFRVDRSIASPRLPLAIATNKNEVVEKEPAVIAGYPQGLPLKFDEEGQIVESLGGHVRFHADVMPGNSGGPIMDERHLVLGLVGRFTQMNRTIADPTVIARLCPADFSTLSTPIKPCNLHTDCDVLVEQCVATGLDAMGGYVAFGDPNMIDVARVCGQAASGCTPNEDTCVEQTKCDPTKPNSACQGDVGSGTWNMLRSPEVNARGLLGQLTYGATGDWDGDGALDIAKLSAQASSGNFFLQEFYGNGQIGTARDTGIRNDDRPGTTNSGILMQSYDDNGDQIDDLLININGAFRAFRGAPSGLQVASATLPPADRGYLAADVGDFNNDGYQDWALTYNPTDIVYGGPNGPLAPVRMQGFPTLYEDDGKYVTVAGDAFSTYPNALLGLNLDSRDSALHVEIFDGDIPEGFMNGDWRTGAGGTCFQLIADPGRDGRGTTVLAAVPATSMRNQGWTSLYSGPQHASALSSATNSYHYRVLATLSETCSTSALETANPALDIINSFKMRGNGNLYLVDAHISFFASDAAGPYSAERAALFNDRDTDFNGVFEFVIPVGAGGSGRMTLRDADADFTNDHDGPGGAAPAAAEGANDRIRYYLVPGSCDLNVLCGVAESCDVSRLCNVLASNFDVSGNYDPALGQTELEERIVDVSSVTGNVRWRWENVWTDNNIFVFAPPASPVTYRMYGEAAQIQAIPVSSARSADAWRNALSDIPRYLPIVLGRAYTVGPVQLPAGSSTLVLSTLQASLILGPNPLKPSLNDFKRELLAAELNLQRATALGENLASAMLDGTTRTVLAVLQDARNALAARCVASLGNDSQLVPHTRLLRAINAGQINYRQPALAEPVPAPGPVPPLCLF
jgi:Trypsin-like peptidase domain